ncbi:helix-turn-helix domain-containing protein [Flavobacterium johnsoniae]|uniref:helix-turn-helix domain-containing protein n=1 Tax=Flavobacterium johnsoniae TaxID=986 RepID=UPI000932F96E|nr:helix-turn-helix transcriptional regulator [Flavobacterium johnsoniae]
MIESEKIFIQSVGEKLKEIRLSKNLSQENLSLESDVPRNVIGRIERGETNAKIVTLHKICNALKISPRELFN